MKLLAVEDARGRMLAEIAPLAAETLPLSKAIGRVLAREHAVDADLVIPDMIPFADELLLDFEPGLAQAVSHRLEAPPRGCFLPAPLVPLRLLQS